MNKMLPLLTLLFALSITQAFAQPFSIATSPRAQTAVNGSATYSVQVTANASFTASVYFQASAPTLPSATLSFSKASINYPYPQTNLTITLTGPKISGTHPIVIEAYNGPTTVRDTVMLNVPATSGAWQVFDTSNSVLPDNSITAIAVDRNGMGWIGTDKGLASYDGVAWTLYDSSKGLVPGNTPVRGIAVDSTNDVWVSFGNVTISHYSKGRWTTMQTAWMGTYADLHEGVAADRSGNIWVGTNGSILEKFDGKSWTRDTMSVGRMNSIAVEANGAVWMSNSSYRDGVVRFDGTYQTHFTSDDIPLGGSTQGTLAIDRSGRVRLACEGGLAMFENNRWTGIDAATGRFPGPEPTIAAFDPSGRTWVGNRSRSSHIGGLLRYDGINSSYFTVENSDMPENNVTALVADNNGRIWIGTAAHGLAIIDGNTDTSRLYSSVRNDRASGTMSGINAIQPNPATSTARIAYTLQTATHVRVEFYDALGTYVATIADAQMEAGEHAATIGTHELAPGTYFVKLSAGSMIDARPLVVVH